MVENESYKKVIWVGVVWKQTGLLCENLLCEKYEIIEKFL